MENQKLELTIEFESMEEMKEILASWTRTYASSKKGTGAEIVAKDGQAIISGAPGQAEMAKLVIEKLCEQFRQQEYIDENKISYFLDLAGDGEMGKRPGSDARRGRGDQPRQAHQCRTLGQKRYMEAIDHNTVVLPLARRGRERHT